MQAKFTIGDTIRHISDGEVCTILEIHITFDTVRYTVSSKEVNIKEKMIVDGVKTLDESELEAIVEPLEEKENEK